jgi:hypothetical protein
LWGKPEQLWAERSAGVDEEGRPYLGLAESLIAETIARTIPHLEPSIDAPRFRHSNSPGARYWSAKASAKNALMRLERAADILPNSIVYQLIGLLHEMEEPNWPG